MIYLLLILIVLYLIIAICATAFQQLCRDRAWFTKDPTKIMHPTANELIDLLSKSIGEGLFWPMTILKYMSKDHKKSETS